ncbi:uncharacterized protein KRP23_13790 [Phytophthora ramorum]|uniref:uncharacterized protein n=1 Tax=Phytophthora ramorum TaxID=164328 RepID=UPI0030AF3302|nr:hypothetical protein KRP23_13790 [Phytophthora ramorum]
MPSLLRDLFAMVASPSQAAKRSLQPPSARRSSANQNVATSVAPLADLSIHRRSSTRVISECEQEQAKMDTFVFFTMLW